MKLKEGIAIKKILNKEVAITPMSGDGSFNGMVNLNATSAAILHMLERDTTPEAIAEDMAQRFGIDTARARADVDAVLAQLRVHGMLSE